MDFSKPLQTRNGRPVRILATDRIHDRYPVVALVGGMQGEERLLSYTLDGSYNGINDSPYDLVYAPLVDPDSIPWSALKDEIRYVAMDSSGKWYAYRSLPMKLSTQWVGGDGSGPIASLSSVKMPDISTKYWEETCVERPEKYGGGKA